MQIKLIILRQNIYNKRERAILNSSRLSPGYRELGIAQNKVYNKQNKSSNLYTGEEALKKASELNPDNFDAYASLGGIYKRLGQYGQSLQMYNNSLEVSNGHPYPLLNAIILQVREKGPGSITGKQKLYMKRAEVQLRKQVSDHPAYNAPWSYFDLSATDLLSGKKDDALSVLEEGLVNANDWEARTHLDTLLLMENQKAGLPGYDGIINALKSVVQ